MRIQIYTQFFVPEVTAPRYRVEALAQSFVASGHEVEIICPVPNHPVGVVPVEYRGRPLISRRVGGATVRYVWVRTGPVKNMSTRLACYATYAGMAVAVGMTRKRPTVILASSPPLSVAAAAAAVAAVRGVPWILDVRDLWPKAALAIGELREGRAYAAAQRLEALLYRRADRITTVTRPFLDEIARGVGPAKVTLIPNGTTRMWIEAGERTVDRSALGLPRAQFVWAYAGNLGPSRKLDVAIEAARRLGSGFRLVIIGDGGARAQLEDVASELPPGIVEFPGIMPAERAAEYLRAADAAFVPQQRSLADFVPSKLYDCCAVGRPLVVAAIGETAALTEQAGVGVVADPDSPDEIAVAVRRLAEDKEFAKRLGENGRSFAADNLRERQGERMVALAEQLAQRGRP